MIRQSEYGRPIGEVGGRALNKRKAGTGRARGTGREENARRRRNAAPSKPLRVGVTLYIRDGQQTLWENGIFQNVYFLLMLLNRSSAVERCFVVNGGPCSATEARELLADAPAPVLTLDEAMNELDVIIEFSAQLSAEWLTSFKGKGGWVVSMKVANDHIIDVERMIYNLPSGQLLSGGPIDEVWMLPAFEKTCKGYYMTGLRAPVRVMQHLWSPCLLEANLKRRGDGATFAYQPGRHRWRLGIFEANICSVKTCHLPMLACDMAYRRDPRAIEIMRVFSAVPIKDNAHFIAYARSLDLVRHGIGSFEARYPIIDVMGHYADAIVSHHWENGQNYLYYEALYGGFPLIHNSDWLDDCGYHYRSFDPEDGGLAILQARHEHDRGLDDYRRRASAFLARLDPENGANIEAYTRALAAIVARRPGV